jgi:lipopolysaccharide export system permease protein
MKILSRYFTKQLAAIFLMLLAVLTGLAWMLQIMSMMKFLITYGVNLGDFMGLTVLMIPFIASIIIPFVSFIATIFIHNKLIGDNEITVMAGVGMSPARIARPALGLAAILAGIHLALNVWVVPSTQARFYDRQWELRYGLAHMKLQESAFTQLSEGLVVYVDKVAGHDMSQLMLSDTRNSRSELTIFAETGKLVSTVRGLSIVMENGSLMSRDNSLTVGKFETFDMDLNVVDQGEDSSFRARRIRTSDLLRTVAHQDDQRHHELFLTEICTRLMMPWMNIILAGLCVLILLKSSLLRRRTSFAPVVAVACMAVTMALFMSASNMLTSITDLVLLAIGQVVLLCGIFIALINKGIRHRA